MSYERNLFSPRSYQMPARLTRRNGYRRFIMLWHRRAGKDRNGMAFILEESLKRIGNYIHVFPSLNQGRRDVWTNTIQETRNGHEIAFPMLSIFPEELVKRKDSSEMLIEFSHGGSYQIMGADDDDAVDRMRGPNPIGIIFSEYAHGDKMEKAYLTLLPVVAENGGWMMFAYTPNGFNQGLNIWKAAQVDQKNWFTQKLTVNDTFRDSPGESGTPVVSSEEIEILRKNGVREEWIQQEFYCSFTGFQHGTIYGIKIMQAQSEGRIGTIPYITQLPVGVCFDLGQSDSMAIWFYQVMNGAIRFINYWENTQKDIRDAFLALLENRYIYGRVLLPWDGNSARVYLETVGLQNVQVNERTKSLKDSIENVRQQFSTFYFDETRCSKGIEHLRQYARKFDEDLQVFSAQPIHNEHSHAADALRTGVEGGFEPLLFPNQVLAPVKVEMEFDPRAVAQGVL